MVPTVNQVELHPYLQQARGPRVGDELGVLTEAWSPIAKGGDLLADPVVDRTRRQARAYAGPGGAALARAAGHVVIPKSVTPDGSRRTSTCSTSSSTSEDMLELADLDRDGRTGPHPDR